MNIKYNIIIAHRLKAVLLTSDPLSKDSSLTNNIVEIIQFESDKCGIDLKTYTIVQRDSWGEFDIVKIKDNVVTWKFLYSEDRSGYKPYNQIILLALQQT